MSNTPTDRHEPSFVCFELFRDMMTELEEAAFLAVQRGARRALAATAAAMRGEDPPAPTSPPVKAERPSPKPAPRKATATAAPKKARKPPSKKPRGGRARRAEATDPRDLHLPDRPLPGIGEQIYAILERRPRLTLDEVRQALLDDGLDVDGRTIGRVVGGMRTSRVVGSDGAPPPTSRYFTRSAGGAAE